MHKPGEVVLFWSNSAGKEKYHLCISLAGRYLYLNSPKKKAYEGDLLLPCTDFPFLPVTDTGQSVVCCTLVLAPSADEMKSRRVEVKGSVGSDVLLRIIEFVESSDAIADDERDQILDGLGDWL